MTDERNVSMQVFIPTHDVHSRVCLLLFLFSVLCSIDFTLTYHSARLLDLPHSHCLQIVFEISLVKAFYVNFATYLVLLFLFFRVRL